MADETNNKNAVFKFYLNRQGVKGNKGEKGDQGFSPVIEVSENTANSYKLQITTETDQFETPNLRGDEIDTSQGGTYIRYNEETQQMYVAPADNATTTSKGEVTLASDEAIANLSDTNVITPAGIVDNATSLFQSSGGTINITQDETTSKINLEANTSGVQGDITMIQAHLSIHDGQIEQNKSNIDTLEGRVDDCEDNILSNTGRIQTLENNLALDEQAIQNNTSAIGNKVDKVAGKGLSTNDFTNEDKDKLTHAVVNTDLANVAFTGNYIDLINTPAAYSSGLGIDISNTNQISVKVDGTTVAYNLNGELTASGGAVDSVNGQTGAVVLTASDVGALPDSTVIPTVNNPTITFTQGGTTKGTITLNQSDNQTIALDAGGGTVDQTYDATSQNAQSGVAIASAGFLTSSDMSNYLTTNTAQTVTGTKTFQNAELILKSRTYSKFNLENDGNSLCSEAQTSTGFMHFAYNNHQNVATVSANRTNIDGSTRGLLRILPTTVYNHPETEGYIMTHNLVDMSYKPFLTASKITSTGGTVTITDNGMNGINIEAVGGGGGGTPTNMVTTDTDQYVTGTKTSLLKNIRYFDSADGNGLFNGMWLGKSANGYMGLIFDSNIGNSNYYLLNQGQTSTLNVEGFQNFKIKGETENRRCYITNDNLSKGSTPSSTEYIGLLFDDSTGREGEMSDWVQHRLGNVEVSLDSSGTTTMLIDAYRNYGYYPEGMESTQLKLVIDSSGNKTATINTGNFSRTDGTNTYKILDESDNTKFDGQWIYPSTTTVANRVAATSTDTSYDLSSILPNDNHNYEVIFSGFATTGNVAGNRVAVEIQGITDALMCGMSIRTAASQTIYGSCVVVIGTNRTATVLGVTKPNGDYTINITGYRRIGTNS